MDLSGLDIGYLPDEILEMAHVKRLKLGNCLFETLPTKIGKMVKTGQLRSVDLIGCGFSVQDLRNNKDKLQGLTIKLTGKEVKIDDLFEKPDVPNIHARSHNGKNLTTEFGGTTHFFSGGGYLDVRPRSRFPQGMNSGNYLNDALS